MNTTETHAVQGPSMEAVLGGIAASSITEGIGAIGTIALAVIGLAGLYAYEMAAIATIVTGAIILMEGGLVSLACRRLAVLSAGERHARELGGGVTAEFFGGLAGIVLGILAIIGLAPMTLILVGLLCLGASALFSGSTINGSVAHS